MLDIPSISAIVAAVGVLVGVVIAVNELRNLVRQRQSDLVMRLYSEWGSDEIQQAVKTVSELKFEDYDDYVEKYGSSLATEAFKGIWKVTWFFNGVGVLVQSKLAGIELVDKLFGYMVISFGEHLEPVIEGIRKQSSPRMRRGLEWFDYLYNELKKREQGGVKSG